MLRNCNGGRAAHLCSSSSLLSTPTCSFWLLICLRQFFDLLSFCLRCTRPRLSPSLPLPITHIFSLVSIMWAFNVICNFLPQFEIPFFLLSLFLTHHFSSIWGAPALIFHVPALKRTLLAHLPTSLLLYLFLPVCIIYILWINYLCAILNCVGLF